MYFWLEFFVGVVKTELYVPMNFFSRKTHFWENIYYQNHFRFLDGNFPGLRQKFSGRFSILHSNCLEKVVERTICWKQTPAHCFLRFLRFTFFCEFTQIFVGRVVRAELYVSARLFSWEAFSLKKSFLNCISLCGLKYFGYMARSFLHGCHNSILCVQWKIPWRKVFCKTLFFYMRKFSETF